MDASDSMLDDIVKQALNPKRRVSFAQLHTSGLHREVLRSHFEAFAPEIPRLAGWKKLREFEYSPTRNAYPETIHRNKARTEQWQELLASEGMSDWLAILLYDTADDPNNGRFYRVFLERDGHFVFYRTESSSSKAWLISVATIEELFDHIENVYESRGMSQPFLSLLASLPSALAYSNEQRQRQIEETAKLEQLLRAAGDGITR